MNNFDNSVLQASKIRLFLCVKVTKKEKKIPDLSKFL